MRIKKIISRNRRDIQAVYECEHCGHTVESGGYDDEHFHKRVVPSLICAKCGKNAGDDYEPLTPKFREGMLL